MVQGDPKDLKIIPIEMIEDAIPHVFSVKKISAKKSVPAKSKKKNTRPKKGKR